MSVLMRRYNDILTISTSSIMPATLNPNLRMTQIGIRCSRAQNSSQRYQAGNFCQGFVHASNLPKNNSKHLPNYQLKNILNYPPKDLPNDLPKYRPNHLPNYLPNGSIIKFKVEA